MISYIIRRLTLMILVVLFISTIVFVMLRIAPGDPTTAMLGEYASKAAREGLRERLGLNKPLILQYFDFIKNIFTLDFGKSIITGQPVIEEIASVIFYSIRLTLGSLVVAIFIGLVGGIWAFKYAYTKADHLFRILTLLWCSLPPYVLAILLMLLLAFTFNLLPATGRGENSFLTQLRYLVLPSLSLGLYVSGYIARVTRASMLDEVGELYAQTARSKGLSELKVTIKHIFRNALVPILTVTGVYIPVILGGIVIVESIFVRPGIGTLLFNAVKSRDYPTVQFTIIIFAFVVAIVNLLVDLAYAWVDPRIRYE